MYLILLTVMIVASVSLIIHSFIGSRLERQARMKDRLINEKGSFTTFSGQPGSGSSSGKWLTKDAAPFLANLIKPKSEQDQIRLRVKLANAGFRSQGTLVLFLAAKIIIGLTLLVLVFMSSASSGYSFRNVFSLAGAGGSIGFMLPDLWLYLVAKSRREKITYSLPDCIDLLVICVESGLGLDAAMQRVSAEMGRAHPELGEEFTLVTMEVQMGIGRSEALFNLGTRTGVSELKALSALLIQAERFGTSIADTLRIHADYLRTKRCQAAEERAQKATVKLILPLIFFIFPAIFVVLAGPAGLKLWQAFTSGEL